MPVFVTVLLAVSGGLVLLFFLYLLSMRPNKPRKETAAFCRHYAHRGLWGDGIAENSLSAFRLAAEEGCAVELDVQLSKDGVPVVFHDETLARVTGMPGAVHDYTADELAGFSLSGTEEGIPSFRAVLDAIGGRVPILMEIKSEYRRDDVCRAAIETLEGYDGPVCMESFHPLAVRYFRKRCPDTVRGFLWARTFRRREFRRPLYVAVWLFCFNFLCRPDFVAVCGDDFNDFPLTLFRLFYRCRVLVWTVRHPEDYALLAPYVDGGIYDHCRLEEKPNPSSEETK